MSKTHELLDPILGHHCCQHQLPGQFNTWESPLQIQTTHTWLSPECVLGSGNQERKECFEQQSNQLYEKKVLELWTTNSIRILVEHTMGGETHGGGPRCIGGGPGQVGGAQGGLWGLPVHEGGCGGTVGARRHVGTRW